MKSKNGYRNLKIFVALPVDFVKKIISLFRQSKIIQKQNKRKQKENYNFQWNFLYFSTIHIWKISVIVLCRNIARAKTWKKFSKYLPTHKRARPAHSSNQSGIPNYAKRLGNVARFPLGFPECQLDSREKGTLCKDQKQKRRRTVTD